MNASLIAPEHRAISIVALVQAGVIVGGTLFVTAMMKVVSYQAHRSSDSLFCKQALFVRSDGFTLLLLPVLWVTTALFCERDSSTQRIFIFLGILLSVFGMCFYVGLGFNPRPPCLIGVSH